MLIREVFASSRWEKKLGLSDKASDLETDSVKISHRSVAQVLDDAGQECQSPQLDCVVLQPEDVEAGRAFGIIWKSTEKHHVFNIGVN